MKNQIYVSSHNTNTIKQTKSSQHQAKQDIQNKNAMRFHFSLTKKIITIVLVITIGYGIVLAIAFSFGGVSFAELDRQILFELRAPRILMAILVGALLASSGVVVQSVFANPLADPYIIGVASSATLGAVSAYLLGLSDVYYGILGFISSVGISLLIFAIGGRKDMSTLLMIGIAISSFLGAFTTFAIYLIGEDSFKITAWLMGFFGNANWDRVYILCLPTIFCMMYFFSKRLELNIILHGDDEARSLGVNVGRLKIKLLVVSSLAVGFCVGFSGLIGFVGLIIPHILRLFLRNSNHAIILPLSFLLGGLFLLACDSFGRSIWSPIEIPIGAITAFFGAPLFLYLALKRR